MQSESEPNWEEWKEIWADAYILMCLGALEGRARERLLKTIDGYPTERATPEEWREVFEGEFSIRGNTPSIIEQLWEEQKREDPGLTPEAFAARNREGIFIGALY